MRQMERQSVARRASWPGLLLALGLALSTLSCEPPPCCRSAADCADGYGCVAGSCRRLCRFPGQCPSDQRCDVERGVCVGGAQRSDCPVASADSGPGDATGVDAARDASPADLVGSDRQATDLAGLDTRGRDRAGVDGGLADRGSLDRAPLDAEVEDKPPDDLSGRDTADLCVDDIFEQNDTRQQAALLSGAPIEAMICPGDPDFFVVDRGPNSTVRAVLGCPDVTETVRLILRLPGDARQARSCAPGDGEVEASLSVPEPGPAYVEVSSASGSGQPFSLQVFTEGDPPPCGTDAFEPNNVVQDAFAVQFGASLNASTCADDVDHYAVPMTVGTTLTVRQATAASCVGDGLSLLAPDGSTVLAEDSSGGAQRLVSTEVVQSGNHYIRVRSGCVSDSYYALSVGESACAEDGYEENDQLASAATIGPGYLAGAICSGDDDYFAQQISEATSLRFDLRFSHSVGDLDLMLFDHRDRRVGLSQGVSDVEVVEYRASQAGRYTARVYGFNGAQGPYSLDACVDDDFEENDRRERAAALTVAEHALVLCRGDADFFSLLLPGAVLLDVELVIGNADASVTLRLLRASDGSTLATGASTGSGLGLSYLADTTESVVIAIENGGQSSPYRLLLDTRSD